MVFILYISANADFALFCGQRVKSMLSFFKCVTVHLVVKMITVIKMIMMIIMEIIMKMIMIKMMAIGGRLQFERGEPSKPSLPPLAANNYCVADHNEEDEDDDHDHDHDDDKIF